MNNRCSILFLAAILLASCADQDSKPLAEQGTTIEPGTFFLQDGKRASNVAVSVFVSGGTDTLPALRTSTDDDGRVRLSTLPEGYYSLLVSDQAGHAIYFDSIRSDGTNTTLPSDTLRQTGSITGRIQVQPADSPRIARVALLGEGDHEHAVDDSGFFTLSGIAPGRHALVAKSTSDKYFDVRRGAVVSPASTTDLGNIPLEYSGLPYVTGFVGTWDSLAGSVSLKWDPSASPKMKGFAVYRSTTGDTSTEKLLQYVDSGSSALVDTVFQRTLGEAGRLSADSATVTYRVSTIGQANTEGPRSDSWTATLRRPFLVAQLPATWKKRSDDLPDFVSRLDTLPGSLLAFGTDDSRTTTVWKSDDDGSTWTTLVSEPLPTGNNMGLTKSVVHRGELRWVKAVPSLRESPPPSWGYGPNQVFADSLRIMRLDGSGRLDSTTIPASNDSVSYAIVVLDSSGLVLVEGKLGYANGSGIPYFLPAVRRLETSDGTWRAGGWAGWYAMVYDSTLLSYRLTVRSVSILGRSSVHLDAGEGSLLDLDSLTLSANGSLSYVRSTTPDLRHKVQGGPSDLTGIAWEDGTIYVIGEGVVWSLTLP